MLGFLIPEEDFLNSSRYLTACCVQPAPSYVRVDVDSTFFPSIISSRRCFYTLAWNTKNIPLGR
ncbi:hypothetical protein M413DRAFT_268492 [Hebeloma cylindrosporum]|uniref:Uncharacterized protein n=1 Tax=Hebeloma cylindrosporum TaxID=76867 RepID=A0A0C2Z1I4_HEBCY|nr:hypothetical protein M413DRAFT_268492 [Hebeloma cylindrosporum h7]